MRSATRVALIFLVCFLGFSYEQEFTQRFGTIADNGTVTNLSNGVAFVDQVAPLGQNYYSYNISSTSDSLLTLVVSASVTNHLIVLSAPGAQPTMGSYTKAAYRVNSKFNKFMVLLIGRSQ